MTWAQASGPRHGGERYPLRVLLDVGEENGWPRSPPTCRRRRYLRRFWQSPFKLEQRLERPVRDHLLWRCHRHSEQRHSVLAALDLRAASRSIRNATISRKVRTSRINLGQALGGRLSYQNLSALRSLAAQSPVAPLR